jgi:hypothetical protein
MSLTEFFTNVATNTQSTFEVTESSPHVHMLLVLLSNEQHSFLPLILVSVVVVTFRLPSTATKGYPDTNGQILYMNEMVPLCNTFPGTSLIRIF